MDPVHDRGLDYQENFFKLFPLPAVPMRQSYRRYQGLPQPKAIFQQLNTQVLEEEKLGDSYLVQALRPEDHQKWFPCQQLQHLNHTKANFSGRCWVALVLGTQAILGDGLPQVPYSPLLAFVTGMTFSSAMRAEEKRKDFFLPQIDHSRSNQKTIWEVFLDQTDFYTNPSLILRGGRETSFVGPSRVRPIPKVETAKKKKKTIGGWSRPNRRMHWITIARKAPAENPKHPQSKTEILVHIFFSRV